MAAVPRWAGAKDLHSPASPIMVGGRFQVRAALGRGGMGEVLRVREEGTGRVLALKRLRPDRSHRDTDELRFRREFHTMAGLAHPCIVTVHDFGYDGGAPWYTMELLDGQDLSALGQVEWSRACAIVRQVCSALAFLHQRGLVHRDLTPRNVRLTVSGEAKLIDFGVLGTVGMEGAVVGTPPFIPPESLRELPLDHRADLYGVGALLYRMLTGRHAFPARRVEELEAAWRQRPPEPAALVPTIPQAVSELVMSLVARDPAARPGSAAELIDRLGALADLPPLEELQTARGYLASAAMVGRKGELKRIHQRLAKIMAGDGRCVTVEAPSGFGKSRLLREAALQAKLAGASTAEARGGSIEAQGPYGVLRCLARTLLTAAREETLPRPGRDAAIVARVVPEVGALMAPIREEGPLDQRKRIRVQAALVDWLLGVAARRPLVFVVDDVQRCDEGSAAVLGALAHEAGKAALGLIVSVRTDEPVRAPAAISAIRVASTRLRLEGLSAREVEVLCRDTFGDAPNLGRLSRWLQRTAGGSPLHVNELLREVVERGVARFADGIWSIPASFDGVEVPRGLAEAMDERVGALGGAARALGVALAVHGGELPLALCMALAGPGAEEVTIFRALDELCFQQVLVRSEETYAFRHDGLREALLRLPDEAALAGLHRRVADVLLEEPELSPDREAEVGWHLIKSGDEQQGAALLERAGLRLHEAQSFTDAAPCLEAALTVLEASGPPRARTMPLRLALLNLGFFLHKDYTHRYLDETVAQLRRSSGLALAERLRSVTGAYLALGLGLSWAWIRRLFTPTSRRGLAPFAALTELFPVISFASSVYMASFDLARLRAVRRHVAIFAKLRGTVARGAWVLCRSLVEVITGRWRLVLDDMAEGLEILARPSRFRIREVDHRTAQGAGYFARAFVYAHEHDPRCLEEAAALERLEMRFFELSAKMSRSLYHRSRGEEAAARRLDKAIELAFVQLGDMWAITTAHTWCAAFAYVYARDVLGLRRSLEELEALRDKGQVADFCVDIVRGEYYRERGDTGRSLTALRAALAAIDPEDIHFGSVAQAALAETLLARGELEEADRAAVRGFEMLAHPQALGVPVRIRLQCVRGEVAARRGERTEAEALLDEVIRAAEDRGSPTLAGAAHEVRARAALVVGDDAAAERHTSACLAWVKRAENPSLLARAERLVGARAQVQAAAGAQGGEGRALLAAAETAATSQYSKGVATLLSGCKDATERAARVLELVREQTNAMRVQLFLCSKGGGIQLAAPADQDLDAALYADMLHFLADLEQTNPVKDDSVSLEQTLPVYGGGGAGADGDPSFVALCTHQRHRDVVIGALALWPGEGGLRPANPEALELLSDALYRAGDAVTLCESDVDWAVPPSGG